MSKQTFIMSHDLARARAVEAVKAAPAGFSVTVAEPRRSGDQNAIFHALCGDIAKSGLKWMGKPRSKNQWKVLLISGHAVATNEGSEVVPGIEGEFVNIRESSADMSKSRGTSLIEYTMAFAASHGIELERRAA